MSYSMRKSERISKTALGRPSCGACLGSCSSPSSSSSSSSSRMAAAPSVPLNLGVALCVTGQLSRLEFQSKLANILVPLQQHWRERGGQGVGVGAFFALERGAAEFVNKDTVIVQGEKGEGGGARECGGRARAVGGRLGGGGALATVRFV